MRIAVCRHVAITVMILCGLLAEAGRAQMADDRPCPCRSNYLFTQVAASDSVMSTDSLWPPLKSPSKALNYSAVGTVAPLPTLILTVPGIIFGPSLGYFYAGMPGRAWTGIGIRTAGIGGMVSSFAICGWDCGSNDDAFTLAWVVFVSGGALAVGSAIYDLGHIKRDVRKRNDELRYNMRLTIGPRYYADAKAPGIGAVLTF